MISPRSTQEITSSLKISRSCIRSKQWGPSGSCRKFPSLTIKRLRESYRVFAASGAEIQGFEYGKSAFTKHTHKSTLLSGSQIGFEFIRTGIVGGNDIGGGFVRPYYNMEKEIDKLEGIDRLLA